MTKLINWPSIYKQPGLFHIYLTQRKRGKTDCKAWTFLESIISQENTRFVWLRRHWHDSLECTKPYFQDLVYKFAEEKGLNPNHFEVQEQGLFYQEKKRIYFFDLFSFRKARGKIARGVEFEEIVYEEAIPLDQEVLPREQWKLKDLIESLKRKEQKLKVTFLANPYLFSMYFLDHIPGLQTLRKRAEELAKEGNNDGVKAWSEGRQWFLYLNLLPGKVDAHSEALEEQVNPSLVNWDDYMIEEEKVKKYSIVYAVADYYFCEVGERKVHKKYCFMHFSRNVKETDSKLVNFCFSVEEMAKSKLKNCRLREEKKVVMKWVKMLKENMLYFADYRSRDWFLSQLRGNS
jgi:hypothetical protein